MRKSFTVDEDFNNSRLDKWFKQKILNLPHSLIEKIIRNNKIKINKKKTKSSYRLQTGDLVEIFDINRFWHRTTNLKFIFFKNLLSYKSKFFLINENLLSRFFFSSLSQLILFWTPILKFFLAIKYLMPFSLFKLKVFRLGIFNR